MQTPVLLLVYNRPRQTELVLSRLQQCGILKIHVSADGPKNAADRNQTNEVVEVLSRFDHLILNKRFSEKNLGCQAGVIEGINWFFEQVDDGIILEDDCLPSPQFFPFINNMLSSYRYEPKVMMLGGNNPLGDWPAEGGHFFSRIGTIWGWATWKDRWQTFNPKLPSFNNFVLNRGFEREFGPTKLAASRVDLTKKSLSGEIDTWDYQWNTHLLMCHGLALVPERNLVENIGFNSDGTNVHSKPNWIQNSVAIEPIQIGPRPIQIDHEFEMEWEFSRRSGLMANTSSFAFEQTAKAENRKLKILLINSTDIGGGAEKIALTLHLKLLNLGHESLLLVPFKKSELDSVEVIDDWKTQIYEFEPDVIHVHNLHGTSILLSEFLNFFQKIPVLFTLHDAWLISGSTEHPFEPSPLKLNLLDLRAWKKEFKLRNELLKNSQFRFTAPSQWMRELFFNAHGVRPYFVPNAVEDHRSIEIEFPSERFILFVANRPNTNPYKDFATLKKAWKKANKKLSENSCDLIVLGSQSETIEVENHFVFMLEKQSAQRVSAFMKKSLLVIQASVQDNAPLSILEAHSVGTKVVGSLVGGIPELLDDEEKTWLYESENVNQLSEKLIGAIRSSTGIIATKDRVGSHLEQMVNTYLGHYCVMTFGN